MGNTKQKEAFNTWVKKFQQMTFRNIFLIYLEYRV